MDEETHRKEVSKRQKIAFVAIAICVIGLLILQLIASQTDTAISPTDATATFGAQQFATWVAAQTPAP